MPNPLRLLSALRPRSLVSLAQGQGKRVQRLVWRLEDASVFTAKFAVKAVVKGVRPALVCECRCAVANQSCARVEEHVEARGQAAAHRVLLHPFWAGGSCRACARH